MTTRLYIDDAAPAVTPDSGVMGSWTYQTGAEFRQLNPTPGGTSLVTGGAIGPITNADFAILVAAVSDPIEAQTLSPGGTWTCSAQMRVLELLAADDIFTGFEVIVVSGDGLTHRGTLVPADAGSAVEMATSLTNRSYALSAACSEVIASAGDRIVAIFGFYTSAGGGASGARARYGAPNATADLPVDDSDTTDLRPWVELSGDPTFEAPGGDPDIADSVSVTDTTLAASQYSRAASDAETVADAVSAVKLSGVTYDRSASDSISVADIATPLLFTAPDYNVVISDVLLAPPDAISVNEGPSYVTTFFAIPAVYVDDLEDVALDIGDLYEMFNRDPEPNETAVPIDSAISIDMVPGDPALPAPNPNIFINGVQARDRVLGWLAPFTGVDSSPGAHGGHRRFVVTSHPAWTSEQVVTVRVFQDNAWTFAYPSEDTSYTFIAADILGPYVVEVDVDPILWGANDEQPRQCQRRIRVLFNEDVLMDDSAVGALNPANYVITPLGIPSYSPTVVSVLRVFPLGEAENLQTRYVDLVTDDVLTFLAPYRLTVSNVPDLVGNPFAGPPVDFTAYGPDFSPARRFYLWEMLPPLNQGEDTTQDLAMFIGCIQDLINVLLCLLDDWTDVLDVDLAPRAFLDAMLVDLGDPFQFADLTTLERRKLVRVLFRIHRLRGTIPGMVYAIRFFLGIDVVIEELSRGGWRLGTGLLGTSSTTLGTGNLRTRNTFKVHSAVDLTETQRVRMRAILRAMKPAGKHFLIVEPSSPDFQNHWVLGISQLGVTTILH